MFDYCSHAVRGSGDSTEEAGSKRTAAIQARIWPDKSLLPAARIHGLPSHFVCQTSGVLYSITHPG